MKDRFHSMRPALTRHAFKLLGDVHDAEDAVSDAGICVRKHEAGVDPDRFDNYAYRAVTNHCHEILRKRKTRKHISIEANAVWCDFSFGSPKEFTFGSTTDDIRSSRLSRALARMPLGYREALLLKSEGYTDSQIADLMGSTIPAIKGMLVRGRRIAHRLEAAS